MYLWFTDELAKELKENTLEEEEKFKYYFLMMFLYTISSYEYLLADPEPVDILKYFEMGIVVLFMVVGTISCFKIHQKGDSTNFIERMVLLSIPITMKVIAYGVGAIFWVYVFLPLFESVISETWIQIAAILIMEVIYYWRLWVWIKRISHDELPQKA